MKTKILFIAWLVAGIMTATAQEARIDSLENLIAKAKPDTSLVLLYIAVGNEYENTQPDSAAAYYLKAGALADKLNWAKGQYKFAANYTFI